ncbi:MAG: hypothetical protein B6U68_00825 [Candidatus Aenigmarchaeota archaeon ex4484_14]|nr:MAG: hypothetical protein B6U68_00825 [Candidatus Aenigmarchaeota archaeon ex4484_14]
MNKLKERQTRLNILKAFLKGYNSEIEKYEIYLESEIVKKWEEIDESLEARKRELMDKYQDNWPDRYIKFIEDEKSKLKGRKNKELDPNTNKKRKEKSKDKIEALAKDFYGNLYKDKDFIINNLLKYIEKAKDLREKEKMLKKFSRYAIEKIRNNLREYETQICRVLRHVQSDFSDVTRSWFEYGSVPLEPINNLQDVAV